MKITKERVDTMMNDLRLPAHTNMLGPTYEILK